MATLLWQNHSREDARSGYRAIFFLKRALARGILQAINLWEEKNPLTQYKVGIEVKAIFAKNHPNLQYPSSGEPTKHVMFIHHILNKIIQAPTNKEDYQHLGSLISTVEWQLLDDSHTRDSAHAIANVLEFQIHVYRAQMFQAGWFLFQAPKQARLLPCNNKPPEHRQLLLLLHCVPGVTRPGEAQV